MKKFYTLLLAMGAVFLSNAQITITDLNLPHPGDTARRTRATGNLGLDYHLTGPNYLWDFDTLRAQSQLIDSFLPLIQTDPIYSFYFANTPFNVNKSTFGTHGTAIAGFTNPYNFFYLSPSVYKATGVGATLLGIPVPTGFTKHDTIYNLPLNYGDIDSSNSAYTINIPVGNFNINYGTNRKRVNEVDGWGTLITPHGSYNVLRIKSHITGTDTIYFGPIKFPIAVRQFEYKWLTDSVEIVPVLQINTNVSAGGNETVSAIFFKDDFIKVNPINVDTFYCAGATYQLDYVAQGTFNKTPVATRNVFRAQLSDATGSFAVPVVIGTDTSVYSGTMSITIPANTPAGANYRIRINSTNLPRTGADNGFDITIAPGPISTVTTSGATSFCDGDSVVLNAVSDSTYTYQWQFNGVDIPGANSSTFVALQAGTYNVITTNSCTSIPSPLVTVSINPAPVASFTSQFTGICAGDSTLLTANTVPGYNYQWQFNGFDIPNATNSTYYASQLGDYTLVATNSCGNDTSAATTLIVNAPPVSSINASGPTTFCSGDSLLINALQDSSYTYQWQLNNVDITGATSDNYYASQSGDYSVITTNACGQVVSNIISISTSPSPLSSVVSSTTDFCVGDSSLLSSAYVDPNYTYQWQLNGLDITGATQQDFYALTGGNYTLVVSTTACGTATSTAVSLNAIAAPAASVTAASNTTLCQGDSVQIYTNYTQGYFYQWQVDGNNIVGANDTAIYANAIGNYYLIASNVCGITNSNAITVNVNALPVAAFSASAGSICFGDSSYLVSTTLDTSYTYQWQLNNVDITGATNSDFYASQSGDYTLVVTTPSCGSQTSTPFTLNVIAQVVATFNITSSTICNGDSTLLYAPYNSGYSYQWQFNGVDIPGAVDSLFYASAAGNYSLVASTTLCGTDTSATETLAIILPPVASISAAGVVDFCAGDSVLLSAVTDPGYFYQWQLNGVDITGANYDSYYASQSGVYNAVVTNMCGIVLSNDITVTVTSLPDAAFSNASFTGCIGDSILLSATYDPGFTYQWQLFGIDIPGANASDYYALISGDYTLVVSTALCGVDSSAPVSLTLDPVPVSNVTVAGSTFFCNGDSAVMHGDTLAGYNYQWQFNNVDIPGATSPDYVAYVAGVYNLLVSNACTTVSSPFISISVIPTPDTTIFLSGPTSFCPGDSVVISVTSDPSFTYQWFINGNGSPADTLSSITATQSGTYFCAINSQLGCGKENSSIVTVTVGAAPPFTLQSPAAVCKGDTVLLDATVLPPTLGFQWYMDGLPISGANGQTLLVVDSGSYALQYWNTCDTILSNSVNVIINQLPAAPVISQLADTLTCTTAGVSYQWYFNGTLIPSATSQTYTVSIDGDYTVIITDANGCTNVSQVFTFNSSGIVLNADGYHINISPNPTIDDLQINFGNSINEKVTVSILTVAGSEIKLFETSPTLKGVKSIHINTSTFAAGIYMIEIKIGSKTYHQKIVKQ